MPVYVTKQVSAVSSKNKAIYNNSGPASEDSGVIDEQQADVYGGINQHARSTAKRKTQAASKMDQKTTTAGTNRSHAGAEGINSNLDGRAQEDFIQLESARQHQIQYLDQLISPTNTITKDLSIENLSDDMGRNQHDNKNLILMNERRSTESAELHNLPKFSQSKQTSEVSSCGVIKSGQKKKQQQSGKKNENRPSNEANGEIIMVEDQCPP